MEAHPEGWIGAAQTQTRMRRPSHEAKSFRNQPPSAHTLLRSKGRWPTTKSWMLRIVDGVANGLTTKRSVVLGNTALCRGRWNDRKGRDGGELVKFLHSAVHVFTFTCAAECVCSSSPKVEPQRDLTPSAFLISSIRRRSLRSLARPAGSMHTIRTLNPMRAQQPSQ